MSGLTWPFASPHGDVAEGLGNGLQNRLRQFKSARHLQLIPTFPIASKIRLVAQPIREFTICRVHLTPLFPQRFHLAKFGLNRG